MPPLPIVKEHVGLEGEKLLAFVSASLRNASRRSAMPTTSRASMSMSTVRWGSCSICKLAPLADYLGQLRPGGATLWSARGIADHRRRPRMMQIASFEKLRSLLKEKSIAVGLIADEWCNTLEDIKLFADAAASDYVQIKTPDLGRHQQHHRGGDLLPRQEAWAPALGGTANETDQSARISTHIGLACSPDFMLSKPGLGVDEALMIQTNEMARTLAILATRS